MIETARFLLRPLTPDDATERYSQWFDDEVALNFIAGAKAAHDVPALRAYIEARMGRPDVLFLGIFTRPAGIHIGTIKYEPLNLEQHYAVMGIFIGAPEWRGSGTAAEVIEASGRWLRDQLGIQSIILGVLRTHGAAVRAYEKVGFRPESSHEIPKLDDVIPMVWHIEDLLERNPVSASVNPSSREGMRK